jgi:hypothetical protein
MRSRRVEVVYVAVRGVKVDENVRKTQQDTRPDSQ